MSQTRPGWIRALGIGLLAAAAAAACTIGFQVIPTMHATASQSGTADARNYLDAQNAIEVSDLRQKLAQIRFHELYSRIQEDESALFRAFDGSIVLGDSRCSGFYAYGYLPKNICLAEMNETMRNLTDYTEQVKASQPSVLYISYGINDVKSRLGGEGETGYADFTESQVDELLAVSPDSIVVINSIFPAVQGVLSEEEDQILANYNEQLKDLCQKRGWVYVDNDPLCQEDDSFYASDGIHFASWFYPKWAANMVSAAMLYQEEQL